MTPETLPKPIPPKIMREIAQAELHAVSVGESEAQVFQVAEPPTRYLKITTYTAHDPVRAEVERLRWLKERVPVPEIVAYEETATHQFLLTEAVAGTMAYDESLGWSPHTRLEMLARAAQQFHTQPVADCPFDWRTATQVARAKANVEQNKVLQARFTRDLRERTPADILAEALSLQPEDDNAAVVHGDLYPINLLLSRETGAATAFLDVGRCGIGDPYTDLALIANTIGWHLDAALLPEFFAHYGIDEIDEKRLRFFQLLHVLL